MSVYSLHMISCSELNYKNDIIEPVSFIIKIYLKCKCNSYAHTDVPTPTYTHTHTISQLLNV